MTRRQRSRAVEARADLILADEPSAEAYTAWFETQLHHGTMRRLLYTGYLWFGRAGLVRLTLRWRSGSRVAAWSRGRHR